MKNLTKRNKMIVAISGVLVIVVAAITIFTQVGGSELLGATALVITPSNPTILGVGNSIGLSVNSVYNCNWFSDNAAAVTILGDATAVKSVTVYANAYASANIEARCGLFKTNRVYTWVSVERQAP